MFADRIDQKVAVSVVFVAAMFITILDTSIVNVAIPTIGRQFHVGTASVDGVVIGFLVSLAVFMPLSGWLGDRFGNKLVLLLAILIFTVASALCGVAGNISTLVGFRILQGVGGGVLAPVGMAMLFHVFPPAERLKASTVIIVPTTVAPALGPLLGGVLTDHLSWRWVFYVNVPIGALAVIFGVLFLSDVRHELPGAFDIPGFLLGGGGLALLMYGVSEGPPRGWSNLAVVTTCTLGAVTLVAFAVVELRSRAPMLDLRLYRDHLFRTTLTTVTLMAVSFFATVYLVSLFYQEGLGLSAQTSGLNVFPQAIGITVASPLVTRFLYARFGPRRIMAVGGTLVAVMMGCLSTIGPGTSFWLVRCIAFLLGFGMAGIFIPAQTAGMATIAPVHIGGASTLLNVQQRAGGAIGVAAVTTIVTAIGTTRVVHGHVGPHLAAYRVGFLVAAGVMLLGAVTALAVNDADTAVTMQGRKEPSLAPRNGGAVDPGVSRA